MKWWRMHKSSLYATVRWSLLKFEERVIVFDRKLKFEEWNDELYGQN